MSVFTCESLRRRRLCCCRCGAISLILTIFFALVVGFGLTDDLFFLIIKKELQLIPGSSSVDDWADTDVPTYITFYIFDNQNPDQFSEGAVPVVSEVGPFAYRDYDKKVNLEWNSDESLVTYNRVQYYTFIPEMSIGDPRNYNITVLNVPLLIVLNQQHKIEDLLFRKLEPNLAQFYLTLIRNQTLFVEKTAQEIIWGYSDPMMSMLQILGLIDYSFISLEANITNSNLLYTVQTGKKDLKFVDNVVQWRNMTKINQWASEFASHISGSLSGRFEPRIESHDKQLTVFAEPLFRHLEMKYVDQAPLYGIKVHRYEAIHTSFSNSSEYPPNAGYYAYNYKYGVVNLTAISFQNLPVYFSKPHCLDCDPEYFKNISGYHPDKSKHEPYVRVEPFTGLILEAALYGQTNIRIERNLLIRQLSNVPDVTIYPWFYANRGATIPEDKANDFKLGILLPRIILKIAAIVFLCVSGLIMLCVTGVLLRSYRNSRQLWSNGSLGESPFRIIKKSDLPVGINHSNDHTSLLLDNNRTKGYRTIKQSML